MAEGKKLPISVVISAVDNVTYRVMAINEKIKRITAPVAKVQAAFKTLGDEAGIGKLAKQLGKVGSTGKEFFSELGSALFKVGTIGAAAAGSVFALTKSFADAGDHVATLAARLGMSTDAYQELVYAASRADVDQETFNASMQKFSKGIAEAAAGTGEALVGFNALGISVRDSSGRLRTLENMLPEVADKLGAIKNQNLRNAIAAKLFGREGMKLNGIFVEGAAGLKKLRQEARDVGAVMTPDQIKAAEKFDDGMKSVGATLLMVRNVLGAALAPKIVELGEKLQTYILANREKISAWAAAFAEKLPGYIDTAIRALETFAGIVQKVIGFVQWFADTFGTTATVIAGFALYFNGLTVAAAKFAWSLSGLLGPALKVAWVGFSLILGAVKGLVLGLAALVGWPVLIGAAFVGAALLIWKYWEPISKFFTDIWDKVKGFFGGTTTVKGDLSTSAAPSLAPAAGFGKSVDAAARSTSQKNENHVLVEFANPPAGTTVEAKKADGGLDLSMGWGLAGGMP